MKTQLKNQKNKFRLTVQLTSAIRKAQEGLKNSDAEWAQINALYPYANNLNNTLAHEQDLKKALDEIQLNPFVDSTHKCNFVTSISD